MKKNIDGVIFSAVQPTGVIHIGNYFGAIKNWLHLQNEPTAERFFAVANLHSITIPYEVEKFSTMTRATFATLLACGLDLDRSHLFIQSHILEHTMLSWLLSSVTPFGDLNRMTQFKDKSKAFPEHINAGLFGYPILMAADILLYNAEHIPVGQDQLQHLELTREIAYRFNERFQTNHFKIPQPILTETVKILGLDGSSKMSKSLNNYIGLTEDKVSLTNKIRGAKTDPQRVFKTDKGNPFICNIFSYHQLFSDTSTCQEIVNGCTLATMGCSDCKQYLIDRIWDFIEPIKTRKEELETKPNLLDEYMQEGAGVAREKAQKNIRTIMNIMGF